jgi:hypothetical protein
MLPNAAVEQVAVGSATNPLNVRILESIFPPEKFKVRYGTLCRYVVTSFGKIVLKNSK